MKQRVAAIVGPTAVGKTRIALDVAEQLDAEIISMDSMQIYTGMDVGTDKATEEMRARVPHHLIDLRPPTHELTVAEFQMLARDAIDDITARGRLPLLVGGSGLYFRAVVDDLEFPPRSPEVRAELEEEAERVGARALHSRLSELDPKAAGRIEPDNLRRTIRALEVIELTGRPFSDNDVWDRYESRYDLKAAGLTRPRPELYFRIDERALAMVERGLMAEVDQIRAVGFGPTARQALGYRQVLESPPGTNTYELVGQIARATRRFARRQESWFRADPRIAWFEAGEADAVVAVTEHLRFSETRLPGE
ncbi:MAG: tRNA dimethylallyltransferase [Actinomycetota bacterium]|nr:tRNA dimethylallyltransferase [Actinomycetota bacterium]